MSVWVDTGTVFRRYLSLSLRNPVWIIVGVSQPLVFLVFFGPLMTRALQSSGVPPERAWQVYVPGVLVQLSLFGTAFVGFSVIAEARAGIVDRMRVTPVSRLALLLGRVLRDVVVLVAQAALLVLCAVPFGLRAPIEGVLLGLVFVAFLALSLTSLSYALGLTLRSEDSMSPLLNTLLVPAMLLSGVLLPMSLAPAWLDTISRATPLRYTVDAMREAFAGGVTARPVVVGAIVTGSLCAASVALGVRTFVRRHGE
jgi:ABC-2 type transport system permease protein